MEKGGMGVPHPEVAARIHFLPTSDGGKTVTIPASAGHYSAPMCIDGAYFDVRLTPLAARDIAPGDTVDVDVQFLSPELALPRVSVGTTFTLWEGRTIASGVVTGVLRGSAG
jgi:translation elongation factor EF-Tu-like GTPase